ncbi:MAG: hypothetical protein ACI4LM_06780 [Anaerovoracaceae bacterium]
MRKSKKLRKVFRKSTIIAIAAVVLAAAPAGPAASVSLAAVKHKHPSSSRQAKAAAVKKKNIVKLQNYIRRHGYVTNKGDKAIKKSSYEYGELTNYYAVLKKNGSILFVYYCDDSKDNGKDLVECRYSRPYKNAKITVKNTLNDSAYVTKLGIGAAKYNCDRKYKFSVVRSAGFTKTQIQEGSNMNTSLAFLNWDDLLITKVDLDMDKIGFKNMNY